MADYRASVKDGLFVLRTIGRLEELAKTSLYEHADLETVTSVLEEQGRFMQEVFGACSREGDLVGLTYDNGKVIVPPGFTSAYRKFVDAGWQGLGAHVDYGGAGFPESVFMQSLEFMTASNAALTMCPGLTVGAVDALQHWGSEEQKERYLPKLVSGEWSATMNLTEPHAGSDVGLCSTKAVRNADGTFGITGTKIFISFGEHEMSENIIHLVLARIEGAPPGTKGISLFLVPKYLVNEDGSLGEHNDLSCVSIEHKMGIHSSPTCVMSYGDRTGAIGYLIGEENQGMRAMFTMMNAARIAVGIQGVAIGDAAYQKALQYSTERLQGKEVGGEGHGPAPIIVHPDVRRMLLTMRSLIDAMRCIITYNSSALDFAKALQDQTEAEHWREIGELITPITKAWCTDMGMEVTSLAIQVYGGMGYIEESGVAQHFRDMRIAPIYEGTNGIQAMDLVGRKLPLRMGGVVNEHLQRIRDLDTELAAAGEEFAGIRAALAEGVEHLATATNWIFEHGLSNPKDALAGATPYLRLFGNVTGAWLLAQLALAANNELLAGSSDEAYFRGKITSAKFFATQVMPSAFGLLPAITAGADLLYAIDFEGLASA